MSDQPTFEVYGEPKITKKAFVKLSEIIPAFLKSRAEFRSTFSLSPKRFKLGIGEAGKPFKAYELNDPEKIERLVKPSTVTDASLCFKCRVPGSKSKGEMLFLYWRLDASCYPKVGGIAQIDMTLCNEEDFKERKKGRDRKKIRNWWDVKDDGKGDRNAMGHFHFLLSIWEKMIIGSRPDYGVFRKEGDQFVPTHIFISHTPEYIYQANYFGPKMVEKVGKEKILGIPKFIERCGSLDFLAPWKIKELSTGGILLYEESSTGTPGIVGNMDKLKKHLGILDVNILNIR
jgi:hypothetical protein